MSRMGNVELALWIWMLSAEILVLWMGGFWCQTGTQLYLPTQMVLILQGEEWTGFLEETAMCPLKGDPLNIF